MKEKMTKLTIQVGIAFIGLTVVFGIYFYYNQEMASNVISLIAAKSQAVTDEDGSFSVIGIARNNLFACVTSIGIGFIPFLFLPAWAVISNAMTIGAVLGAGKAAGSMSVGKAVLFGIMPHGIFELPAIFLSMALGIYVCKTLTIKLFGRAKDEKLLPLFNQVAKLFVLIVIPLILVAAAVETWITPAIIGWAGLN